MSTKLKIAHISDSHLLENEAEIIHGVNPYQRLAFIFQYIESNTYDLILFTGDVANNGSETSYIQLLKLTEKLKNKILIIGGNHDDSTQLTKIISQSSKFIIEPKDPFKMGNWQFIFVDTVVKSENYGYLSDVTIRNFKTNLKKVAGFNICVLMHHPLFDVNVPFVDKYKVYNSEKMNGVFTKNVKLVINGHVHNDYTMSKDVLYTSCSSTCFQFTKINKIDTSFFGFKEYIFYDDEIFFNSVFFNQDILSRG